MSTQVQNVKYLNEFNGNRSSTDRGCLLQGIRLRFDRQLLAESSLLHARDVDSS